MKLNSIKKINMNHKKIIRIKNKYNLITKIRRRNPYKDIMKKTNLFFNNKIAYLSAVKDIATGEIVAWSLSQHLQMDLVLKTIENMKENKSIYSFKNILIHSDQGFHYTNPEYIFKIKELNMVQSMSRKGNCIDNAPMETFFGHFKDEVDYKNCRTFEELRALTAEYIKYYNDERQQWELKKMTPVDYRNHLLLAR